MLPTTVAEMVPEALFASTRIGLPLAVASPVYVPETGKLLVANLPPVLELENDSMGLGFRPAQQGDMTTGHALMGNMVRCRMKKSKSAVCGLVCTRQNIQTCGPWDGLGNLRQALCNRDTPERAMNFLHDDCILELLPERPATIVSCNAADVDWSDTPVEAYVRDIVETQEPLDDPELLLTLMERLLLMGASPPVSAAQVKRALAQTRPDLQKGVRKKHGFGGFVGPVLKALNGPDFPLVSKDVLASAALKNKLLSTTETGWGMSDPPQHATSWRLLVSSGLDGDLLPEYKLLNADARSRLCKSWDEACAKFGWKAMQPPRDRPRRKA